MKTMEENPNPDLTKLKKIQAAEPSMGSSRGSSVSKPMDRRTEYGSSAKEAASDDRALQN